ncbi:hyphal anastamosis-8 [Trichoderma cornu-damae]|uniref:Hyphal anastamosis-8 n=1 Tax=Trichoderma cornu-damae TaxID=654480 RepID=A0A9P8QNJ2_9HYPO|nr:hyphal anastamosis-8 [Trichoderma cornu-damae]
MDNQGPSSLTKETLPPPKQQNAAAAAAAIDTPTPAGFGYNEKKRPAALNLTHARTGTASSSSSESSLKVPRTPRFAEATSVHSPVEDRVSPFADPVDPQASESQPGDVGFGYIGNSGSGRESISIPLPPKSPLKSAMRVPGTPARTLNLRSPTFREQEILEKRELETDKEQAKDLKIKVRVRLAKFALRSVHFSCSLIILAMLSSSFAIFNATKSLPQQSKMPSWANGTDPWAQKLVLAMATLSLAISILVFVAYCRGGHRRAEKVGTYYTMFAIGWFIVSLILWVLAAAVFSNSKNNGNNKDLWGWSCVQNTRAEVFSDKVKYSLVCRLQNWTLICIIIEVVLEVISILLYSVIFYRYYSKRRLHKSMDVRDRARSDLYLAQLRSQSAPNTPGFPRSPTAGGAPTTPGLFPPKSPSLSQYAMSPRHPPASFGSLSSINEKSSFTPGAQVVVEPPSQFTRPQAPFRLQAPPSKAPSATPKTQSPLSPGAPPMPPASQSPPPPSETIHEHAPVAADEPTYDAVPIPGAYSGAPATYGQAM